ncbi:hypothetical protein CCP3SC1_1510005 [Gammaproteobacteria bacterium]
MVQNKLNIAELSPIWICLTQLLDIARIFTINPNWVVVGGHDGEIKDLSHFRDRGVFTPRIYEY